MLSVGPGSACDVCLEPFGPDVKAPCSIQCGHVFCVTCLHQMVQSSCPLCRNHFDQRTVVKLHVDMDTVVSTCPTSAQQEARRLQEAIANVANEGTTEARLRQLIADATEFLATQPRDMACLPCASTLNFSDLRVTHRMIAYLCEVKSRQRIQRGELDEHKLQITQLNKEKEELAHEKEELLRSIEVAASIRRDEKETALAVELSLRDHCARAHAAYGTMVE
ncbi:hypothetical protein BDZ94DRAFT_1177982 [Collybia nuda]|uniref:RING-type domain-containing protein n=1 Tax=Collybia nuda TaxID=64659 RepID=A0A9P5XRN0_9AGAR|nr:hypothetical protein BDZ94DRAFT_1177982 [Collybia nuda]